MKFSYWGLMLGLCWTGCYQVQELEPPATDPKLTVQGIFAPGEPLGVQLTRSIPADTVYVFPPVLNATLEVYGEGQFLGRLDSLDRSLDPPVYRARQAIPWQAGQAYELRVQAPGFDAVTARDTVPAFPEAVEWVSAYAERGRDLSPLDVAQRISIQGEAELRIPPQAEVAFYSLRIRGEQEYYQLPNRFEVIDSVFDADLSARITDSAGVTEVTRPYGLIAGFAFGELWTVLPNQEVKLTLRLSGALLREEGPPDSLTLELYAFSPAFARYHQTYDEHMWLRDDPFSEGLNVASNVEGGYGLWGAYQVRRWRIAIEP